MKCKYCGMNFEQKSNNSHNAKRKKYCSSKCQKAAWNKKTYRYEEGKFHWLNQKWIPSVIEDRIWVATGFESIKSYLSRRRWSRPREMAIEINTSAKNIVNLIINKI